MSSHKRPGGLTALAVINFVLGGLSLLGVIAMTTVLPMLGRALEQAPPDMPPEQRAQLQAIAEISGVMFVSLLAVSLIVAVLLIVSGVGYLKLKKFLGRTLGNAYAVVSIIYAIGAVFLLPTALGGGFNIMAIIGLVYPVLTLILLNTTFSDDFVN